LFGGADTNPDQAFAVRAGRFPGVTRCGEH